MEPKDFQEVSRLLIVDDEVNIIKSYKRLFLDTPYEIEYAGSGEEAIEKVSIFKPHIILLDIMMPGIDGYEVCETILKNPHTSNAEIIFISANIEPPSRKKAYQMGADDFIAKPILPEELLSKIAAKVRRRKNYLAKTMIDSLTGLGNRRYYERSIEKYLKMSNMYHKFLALAIIDIDFFKRINDTHGHDIGDFVLKSLSTLLQESLREKDTIARIGGEEFVMLMPIKKQEDVFVILNRFRENIEENQFHHPTNRLKLNITVSIGVALFPIDGNDRDTLFKIADNNLYRAKNGGRNRVEASETLSK
ncbi:MAG: diguanylate cyclase [Deltaproteobacteria bacterium]|jgi:two-component system, cell cycle response regulator|nr:diguanylate cyclase [Deltaproteobacteria bacterium]MBT4527248.1 diguanylate cyclase [Deltaproteobacteria bacterium]